VYGDVKIMTRKLAVRHREENRQTAGIDSMAKKGR